MITNTKYKIWHKNVRTDIIVINIETQIPSAKHKVIGKCVECNKVTYLFIDRRSTVKTFVNQTIRTL